MAFDKALAEIEPFSRSALEGRRWRSSVTVVPGGVADLPDQFLKSGYAMPRGHPALPGLGTRISETSFLLSRGGTMAELRPIYPIHPGEILADEIAELGISGAALAKELHVPANRIYQVIAGKRAMTADTSLRLDQWLGVEAAFWLNLQKRYELDLATEQLGDEIRRTIRRREPDVAA
jgi:addiction module HigA family antidote